MQSCISCDRRKSIYCPRTYKVKPSRDKPCFYRYKRKKVRDSHKDKLRRWLFIKAWRWKNRTWKEIRQKRRALERALRKEGY